MSMLLAPAGAYENSITIQRELGHNVRTEFTHKASGIWWCKLLLPRHRFDRTWVCCPGESKAAATGAAIRQAKRYMKAVAA